MKKSLLRLALASAAVAVASGPATANHSWSTYHWNIATTNAPFDVYVNVASYWRSTTDGTGAARDIIGDAIGDWDDPSQASTAPHTAAHPDGGKAHDGSTYGDYLHPVDAAATGGDPKKCSPISGAIYVCSANYGFRGWLGVATVWTSGSHIIQATTKLNDSYHASGTYASHAWRATVACQEIGHDFGLGHQDENTSNDTSGSCMEYTNNPLGNETPDWHDFEQLQTIYQAHIDGKDPVSGGGGGRPGRAEPGAFTFREVGGAQAGSSETVVKGWGRAIGYDAHGRPNRFEQDVGKGVRKFTHVTWVPGFRPEAHHMGDDHTH